MGPSEQNEKTWAGREMIRISIDRGSLEQARKRRLKHSGVRTSTFETSLPSQPLFIKFYLLT